MCISGTLFKYCTFNYKMYYPLKKHINNLKIANCYLWTLMSHVIDEILPIFKRQYLQHFITIFFFLKLIFKINTLNMVGDENIIFLHAWKSSYQGSNFVLLTDIWKISICYLRTFGRNLRTLIMYTLNKQKIYLDPYSWRCFLKLVYECTNNFSKNVFI